MPIFVTMLDAGRSRSTMLPREQQGEEIVRTTAGPPSALWQAAWRGFQMRCAACGSGRMFRSFLQPVQACAACDIEWTRRTADDFPPYLVILLIGHIVAPAMIWMEMNWHLALWVHLSLWMPVVVLLALMLIQPVKGAVMASQWWHWDFIDTPDGGASPRTEVPALAREFGGDHIPPAIVHSNSDVVKACSGLL